MPDGDSPAQAGDASQSPPASAGEDAGVDVLAALSTCLSDWQQTDSWGEFLEALVKVETAAMQAGHLALHDVCVVLHERIEQLSAHQDRPDEEQCAVLATWPSFAMAWLESPGEPHQAELLVEFLAHPMWPQALAEDEAAALREMLIIESGAHGSASLLEVVIENMDAPSAEDASEDSEGDDGLPGYDGLSGYAKVGAEPRGERGIVPGVRMRTRGGRDDGIENLGADLNLTMPASGGTGEDSATESVDAGTDAVSPGEPDMETAAAERLPEPHAHAAVGEPHSDDAVSAPSETYEGEAPEDTGIHSAFFEADDSGDDAHTAQSVDSDAISEPDFLESDNSGLDAHSAQTIDGDAPGEAAFFESDDGDLDTHPTQNAAGNALSETGFSQPDDGGFDTPQPQPSASDDSIDDAVTEPVPHDDDLDTSQSALTTSDDTIGDAMPESALFEADGADIEMPQPSVVEFDDDIDPITESVDAAWDDAVEAHDPSYLESMHEALEASEPLLADDESENVEPEPAGMGGDACGAAEFDAPDGAGDDDDASLEEAFGGAAADTPAEGGLSDSANEMIDLLIMEASQIASVLADTLPLASDENAQPGERRAALEHFAEQVERFNGAVELLGLEGLRRAGEHYHHNIVALSERDAVLSAESAELLLHVCSAVSDYLEHPAEPITGAALTSLLTHSGWPQPAEAEWVGEVEALLASPAVDIEDDEAEQRAVRALPEDVSLVLPDDVDAEVLDGLLQDLPGQTAEFSNTVATLLSSGTARDVEVAQRIAHTVKGAANTVGVAGLANLTHHLEDILLVLGKHGVMPGRSLGEVLVRASDCLESMGESLLGQGAAPDDALETLQSVLDWANTIDQRGVAALTEHSAPLPRAGDTATEMQSDTESETEADVPVEVQGVAPVVATSMVRVPAPLVDDLLRLVGETIILTGQIQERLDVTSRETHNLRKQYLLVQQLGQEMEELIDLQDLSLPMQRVVNGEAFDALEFDQYNELHTCSRRLVEAATDTREVGQNIEEHLSALKDMLTDQARLNRENQEAVLKTRMVAVQTIVPRLQRSVRQATRLAGKAVELECIGTDTLIDSDVLGRLLDPLMHVLRNAVDHGIEPEAKRLDAGKDVAGTVTLEFQREGNHIVIRCADDGAGLDLEAIRRAAEMRDLVGENVQLSEDELIQLVLQPNFSTRTEATQLSGRGIGLDAVNTQIVELGGSLRMQSEAGKGCQIILRLPLTLVSTHALLVRVTSHVLAVATRGVEQILHPDTGEVSHFGDQTTYRMVDAVYPCTTLTRLLGLPGERRTDDRERCPALLVQADGGLSVVLVDGVVDSRELVIKSMGRYLPKIRGIAGATILGDGSVTPVLDLPELLRVPARQGAPRASKPGDVTGIDVNMPYALVVDDSLSARRSLAQFMTDSGFQVRTARDGIEAVKIMQGRKPDVLLVDLEMPRMNGLELTHHVRANDDTRDVPVIMITSRSTDKHRKQAETAGVTEYLTKPYAEDELMEHVYSVCTTR